MADRIISIKEKDFAEMAIAVSGLASIAEEWAPDCDEEMRREVINGITYYKDKFDKAAKRAF